MVALGPFIQLCGSENVTVAVVYLGAAPAVPRGPCWGGRWVGSGGSPSTISMPCPTERVAALFSTAAQTLVAAGAVSTGSSPRAVSVWWDLLGIR